MMRIKIYTTAIASFRSIGNPPTRLSKLGQYDHRGMLRWHFYICSSSQRRSDSLSNPIISYVEKQSYLVDISKAGSLSKEEYLFLLYILGRRDVLR